MRLVVATDLDGTLLDHSDYSYDAARPALAALKQAGVPLILASSKTAAEIAHLHGALALGETPAIVENGAGLYLPGMRDEGDAAYRQLRAFLREVPGAHDFQAFGDMSVAEIAQATGLAQDAAARAQARRFSEPGIWCGNDDKRREFEAALAEKGVSVRQGGRFLTLSFGRTKADALGMLRNQLGADQLVALGDAPNDAEMLAMADIGVVVRNDHGAAMPDFEPATQARIRHTTLPGPAGWNAAILDILAENNLIAGGVSDG
ncbi:MAG: HAD-IIB family hydrolase [Pseudomonadota bacterium]